jgi:hypothetical protein
MLSIPSYNTPHMLPAAVPGDTKPGIQLTHEIKGDIRESHQALRAPITRLNEGLARMMAGETGAPAPTSWEYQEIPTASTTDLSRR